MQKEELEGVIEFTPELAEKFLASHGRPNNRRSNPAAVNNYRELMAARRWLCSKEFAISVGSDGLLLNGHTRLRAVMAYGGPVKFHIRYDVPIEAFAFMDSFGKRSDAQIGRMLGTDTSLDGALRGLYTLHTGANGAIGVITMERLRAQFADVYCVGVAARRVDRRVGFVGASMLVAMVDKSSADDFVGALARVANREMVTPAAAVNLIRFLDGRSGMPGGSEARRLASATVNSFEQYVGSAALAFVKSTSQRTKSSALDRYLSSVFGERS